MQFLPQKIGLRGVALIAAVACLMVNGCGPTSEPSAGPLAAKPPRPVSVMTLRKSSPPSSFSASGIVKSWKTEEIGFEVAGRVLWVLEPGKNIDGRLVDPDGNVISPGTPLAKLDPARYENSVASAEANLEVARLKKVSVEIRINESFAADLKSAEANLSLAKSEFSRAEQLKRRNAGSQSEVDKAENKLQTAKAAIGVLLASEQQTRAELKSAEADIRRLEQSLRDAQRDLANTVLYASFQGQISDVKVVPGSVVQSGTPVLKLQMMNPIKVDVELSADQSRKLRRRANLPATISYPDGTTQRENAHVYSVDASADPNTRTFTLTTLMLNRLVQESLLSSPSNGSTAGDEAMEDSIVRSEDIWPLEISGMMGQGDDVLLVEEKSIRRDDEGAYLFMVANAKSNDVFPDQLKLQRQRIVELPLRVPFLGNWTFRSVEFVDESDERIEMDRGSMYFGPFQDGLGNLVPPPPQWDGETAMLQTGSQWLLRPGDLVNLDLSEKELQAGFYVSMEAVDQNDGVSSLFVVTDDEKAVKRLPVEIVAGSNLETGSMVEVRSPELADGIKIVVRGSHFLRDGESVAIVQTEAN